jgi:hypothetical protein
VWGTVTSAAASTHSHRQDGQSRFISALRRARRTRVRCSGRVLVGWQGCRRVPESGSVAGQSAGGDRRGRITVDEPACCGRGASHALSISNVERPERLSPAWPLSRACAGAWTMQRRRDLSFRSRARSLRSRARVCPRECALSRSGGPPITLEPASVIPQTCLIAGSPPSARPLACLVLYLLLVPIQLHCSLLSRTQILALSVLTSLSSATFGKTGPCRCHVPYGCSMEPRSNPITDIT